MPRRKKLLAGAVLVLLVTVPVAANVVLMGPLLALSVAVAILGVAALACWAVSTL